MKFELEITGRHSTETGIVLALVLLFIFWQTQQMAWLFAGAIVLLISLVFPIMLRPLAFLWFGLAQVLGFFSSTILLTLVFFLVVTPMGWARRLLKKDTLDLYKFKQGTQSVLREEERTFRKEHLKNPF